MACSIDILNSGFTALSVSISSSKRSLPFAEEYEGIAFICGFITSSNSDRNESVHKSGYESMRSSSLRTVSQTEPYTKSSPLLKFSLVC